MLSAGLEDPEFPQVPLAVWGRDKPMCIYSECPSLCCTHPENDFLGRVWVKGVSVNLCTCVQACVSMSVCKCESG